MLRNCSGTHTQGFYAGLPCRFEGKFVARIIKGIAAGQYTRLCGNHLRGALRSGKVEVQPEGMSDAKRS